ncbi:MAG: serine protease [Methanothrix sp.]
MLKRIMVLFAIIAITCINLIDLSVSEEEKASLLTDLVATVMPGTVFIQTYDSEKRQISSGSGFFISDDGEVVTCNHVVEDKIDNCNLTRKFFYAKVTTPDLKEFFAKAIRYDPEGDLVLLDVVIPRSSVHSLPIRTSYPKAGEDIIVIGAPKLNKFSVTKGIISSIDRTLSDLPHLETAFQIDATISPGSSGGPVFNMNGEVIGVVRSTGGPGLNFVIPAERINNLLSRSSAIPPAEEWNRTFDDIIIQDQSLMFKMPVKETKDGDYIISPFLEKKNETILAKIDPNGNTLWSKKFFEYEILSIQETEDGGYILAGAGRSSDSDNADVALIKTDSDGNEMWNRTEGGSDDEMIWSVQETGDDGYILAGGARPNARPNEGDGWDGLLVKTDLNGKKMWSKTFEEAENDLVLSVQETIDGGFILLRIFESDGSDDSRSSLMKFDSKGNTVWNRTYDEFLDKDDRDRCTIYSVQETTDGGFILAGSISFEDTYASRSALLIKADEDGCPVWSRTLFGLGFKDIKPSVFVSVQETSDGGYILAGFKDHDPWLMKTDSNGNEMWNKTLGGSQSDVILSAQETIDGGYVLAGATRSFRNTLVDDDPVMWLIKLKE